MNCLVGVMSYNRGRYLLNCVKSIQKHFHFPYELVIYDDNSTDPETIGIIQKLEEKVHIVRAGDGKISRKHKGLYQNMNRALEMAASGNFETLFLVQDDTQVIRHVSDREYRKILRILSLPKIAVVVPLFFKKNHVKPYHELLNYHHELDFYYPKSQQQKYMTGLGDIGIFSMQKLKAVRWVFDPGETNNINKGREYGLVRAVLKNPFLAYLPWPKTYRYRISNINDCLTWITDLIYNAGFHPFHDLSPDAEKRLLYRSPDVIPFAEDFLTLKNGERLKKPWNYYESSFPVRMALKKLRNKILSVWV
jgi:glycosyltransferase involved in cell wall biosynthesis